MVSKVWHQGHKHQRKKIDKLIKKKMFMLQREPISKVKQPQKGRKYLQIMYQISIQNI